MDEINTIGFMGEFSIGKMNNEIGSDGNMASFITEEIDDDCDEDNEVDNMEKEEDDELSKEMEDIATAINEFIDKHKGRVAINASFYAFDDNGDVIDSRYFMQGSKEVLEIDTKGKLEELKEIKEEWV